MRLQPFRIGGGFDEYQKAFRVLKSAEGIGGSARSDDGIDGLWRRCRAFALVASTSAYRRAINNAWPQSCTDLLPYYERCLGIVPNPDATETDRRAVVFAEWPAKASAIQRDILARLQRIDSRFAILNLADSLSSTSHDGASFGAWGASQMAFFTTRYILRVQFPLGARALLNSELLQIEQAKRILRDSLPSFWDFTITTSSGFLCDSSPLDITGLN